MNRARTISMGIMAALACTLCFAGGCATDDAATCNDGACSGNKTASCSDKSSCCQGSGDKAASDASMNAPQK